MSAAGAASTDRNDSRQALGAQSDEKSRTGPSPMLIAVLLGGLIAATGVWVDSRR